MHTSVGGYASPMRHTLGWLRSATLEHPFLALEQLDFGGRLRMSD